MVKTYIKNIWEKIVTYKFKIDEEVRFKSFELEGIIKSRSFPIIGKYYLVAVENEPNLNSKGFQFCENELEKINRRKN
jgi:hypothetical protein